MSKPRNDTHRLKISAGQGNLGRVKNAEMSWRHLKDQLRVPTTDASITYGGYMELAYEWFQTPVTRRQVEEDLGGGFADLDSAHAEDKTLGLRTFCTTMQVWTDALGRPEHLYNDKAQLMVGKALSQIEELSKPKQRRVGGVRVRYRHRVGHGNDGPWTELPEGHETFAQQEEKAVRG